MSAWVRVADVPALMHLRTAWALALFDANSAGVVRLCKMSGRSLISIDDLRAEEIRDLVLSASALRQSHSPHDRFATLRGRSIVLLFYEPSTRTRVSFEAGAKRLGADVVNIAADASSVVKGESVADNAMTLSALGFDLAVIRHPETGAAAEFARSFGRPVLNAGDGVGEHPTQALTDAAAVQAHVDVFDPKRTLSIVIVGDIAHSRVAHSNAKMWTALGHDVTLVGPKPLMEPAPKSLACGKGRIAASFKLNPHLKRADVVMALRIQHERLGEQVVGSTAEYARSFGLNARRLKMIGKSALIMHPGPVNRGTEIADEVLDDPRCVIREQVETGVWMRMALLAWALDKKLEG